ncbi:MAG TPA: galactokinase [Myxococcaceae bacterium]|jgi:galactokinase
MTASGTPGTAILARAPGRVNLIGEHTDYNGGYVLPVAIPQQTTVEVVARDDRRVRISSIDMKEEREYVLGQEKAGQGWLDYVQGVTFVLQREGFKNLRGFEARIGSEVPLGSGLSSSAALEVSLLRGLRQAFSLQLDDVRLALLGQKVETEFVGAPVGIMDQMASSLADEKAALFLDTRTMQHERIPLPEGMELIVISSGVAHNHAGGDYKVRRAECERAASMLGVAQLRDLSEADLPRAMALPEPLGRRVRHVVTENARVLATVEALRAEDLPRLGKLLNESHESQSKDYEVSIPEIDLLVRLAQQEPDVFGARLTGGGFGGSILAVARAGSAAKAAGHIAEAYASQVTAKPRILLP